MLNLGRASASTRRRFRPASVELRARSETPAHGSEPPTRAGSDALRRVLVIAASLALLAAIAGTEARVHVATAASVVQTGVAGALDAADLAWQRHLQAGAAADALRSLEREHAHLELEVQRLRAMEREHRRLLGLLDLRDQHELHGVGARVIAAGGIGRRVFRIDRGADDGLTDGMAVLASAGLAGQIVAVGPRWADVLSVTDPGHGLQVSIEGEDARGVLLGSGDDLSLEHVHARTPVDVGAAVVTTGLDGVFPRGILVGRVASVGADGPFHAIRVTPSAPPQVLSEVLVVTGPARGRVARR